MVKGRGRMNRNAVQQIASSLSSAKGLIAREFRPGEYSIQTVQPAIRLTKSSAITVGAGRQTVAAGGFYIPAVSGVTNVGSGLQDISPRLVDDTFTSGSSGIVLNAPGTYMATGHIAVSGTAAILFKSEITIDDVPVQGTQCPAYANALGAAIVPVNGLFSVATSGTIFNIRVSSTSSIIDLGLEDLNQADSVNVTLLMIQSDQFNVNI